ncbi:hypothetical protein E2C01_003386 [Portunus trituberculatus]|uniref:Uncharacterized protein n=1 Tax=Portunus trituberculatus TaxID=210409 RepID=A0A5B7CQX9_PORTR|nr:hypothetical protein [Portunus trituberculatus]
MHYILIYLVPILCINSIIIRVIMIKIITIIFSFQCLAFFRKYKNKPTTSGLHCLYLYS